MGHVLLRELSGVDTPSLFQVWGGRKSLDFRGRLAWASISQRGLGPHLPGTELVSWIESKVCNLFLRSRHAGNSYCCGVSVIGGLSGGTDLYVRVWSRICRV